MMTEFSSWKKEQTDTLSGSPIKSCQPTRNNSFDELANNHNDVQPPPCAVNKDLILFGLSATGCGEELRRAFGTGMHFFLPKPVDMTRLETVIQCLKYDLPLQSMLSNLQIILKPTTNSDIGLLPYAESMISRNLEESRTFESFT